MLAHGPRPAPAVIPVLPRQRPDRGPHLIVQPQIRIQPDPPARRAQPVVQFGILVMAEARVIAADKLKPVQIHRRVMAVIDLARAAPAAMRRPARTQGRIHDPGGGALKTALAARIHRHHHRDDLEPGQPVGQRHGIAGRIDRMGIGAHEDAVMLAPGFGHGAVDAGRLQPGRVVDQPQTRKLGPKGGDDPACGIRAAAIGDDHIGIGKPRVTAHERAQAGLDPARLVQRRHHDQDFAARNANRRPARRLMHGHAAPPAISGRWRRWRRLVSVGSTPSRRRQ